MESIQLAQMLADLSDLNAAQEAQAAVALVNANKSLPASTPATTSAAEPSKAPTETPIRPGQRHHQRMGSASSFISRTASPAKFDKFGRRILTPPMSRTNSTQGSIPGTPRAELDDDVDKANSLMALYDIRMKVKEQDHTSLLKLREKIAALQARQQMEKKEGSADSNRHSPYTYPKASA